MLNLLKILKQFILIIISTIFLIYILHTKTLFAEKNSTPLITSTKINNIISLIENNKWNQALKIANKVKSEDLINLINWIRVFSPNNTNIEDLINIYTNYQKWPNISSTKSIIEKKIDWSEENPKFYNFFNDKKPISHLGKIKIHTYLLNNGNKINNELIINSWILGVFSKKDEKIILKNYKDIFNNNINISRLNYLIWNKHWPSVYRQIKRVDAESSKLFKARIKLSRREYGVDRAIKNVPKNLINDEGLVYERVKWRRKAKTNTSLILLSRYINNNKLNFPDRWWNEINIHTRKLLKDKKYEEAYLLLSNHQQKSVNNISNAEWLLGWISLIHLSKPKQALIHFSKMQNIVNMPISIARANYWLARTEKRLDNLDIADEYFTKAALFNSTFYGLIAEQEIGKESKFFILEHLNIDNKLNLSNNTIFRALSLLSIANEKKYSTKFINGLFSKKISEQEIKYILNIFHKTKRTDLYIRACKKAIRQYIKFQGCLFPYPNNISINTSIKFIDDALIFAIIKQESEFFINAKSSKGARGLMQIMPSTGKTVSNNLSIKFDKKKLSNNAIYNITIGSKYFYELVKHYNGSIILAIAGYNAGPRNVKKWLKDYGDPRKNEIDFINWIESIPFNETRNYVQRVIENYIIYQKVIILESKKQQKNIKDIFIHE